LAVLHCTANQLQSVNHREKIETGMGTFSVPLNETFIAYNPKTQYKTRMKRRRVCLHL